MKNYGREVLGESKKFAGDTLLDIVTIAEYLDHIVPESKVYQIITEYNAETKIESFNQLLGYPDPYGETTNLDAVYKRGIAIVGPNTHDHLTKQLLSQLEIKFQYNLQTFEQNVETMIENCLNQFGLPTHLVDFDNNLWGVMSNDPEDIKIKRFSPDTKASPGQSAILVYCPKKHAAFQFYPFPEDTNGKL